MILPFHSLCNNELHQLLYSDPSDNETTLETYRHKIFNQFSSHPDSHQEETDPDHFIQNNLNICNPICDYHFPDELPSILNINNNIKIAFMNINSLPKKLESFKEECRGFLCNSVDILGFCETKLTDDIVQLYSLPYYHLFSNNVSRDKGGVALYIHNKHHSHTRRDLSKLSHHYESLFVEINGQQRNILVGVIYRRPHSNINDFLSSLHDLFSIIQQENKLCYITGDFNIDLLQFETSKHASDLISLFHSHFFYCTVTRPTRVHGNTATLIDHIWSNDLNNQINGIIRSGISDHFPVFSCFSTTSRPPTEGKVVTKTYRVYNDESIGRYREELAATDWTNLYAHHDANECFDKLHNQLTSLHDKHFPLRNKHIKEQHSSNPYITNEIKSLIRQRNKLQRKFYKKTITYGDAFRSLRNRISQMIRTAKANYFKSKLTEASGNCKRTWAVINTILGRKAKSSHSITATHETQSVPDVFNTHFVNISKDLAAKISQPSSPFSSYLPNPNVNTLHLRPVTETELLNIIENSRDNAAGYDELPMQVIKKVATVLCPILTHVFNISISTGVFPEKMKLARVTPIYKSGPSSKPVNYRPISVLISLSKLLERALYNRLMDFITENNILSPSQYGFRPKRSTETALLSFTNHVLNAFDNNSYLLCIFLDLSKAFDTVNHSILLTKLHHYGVKGVAHTWFASYLSGRHQHVRVNGQTSTNLPVSCGVPQGSILGPLLFLLYINDICHSSKLLHFILFADDSALFSSDNNILNLLNNVNKELKLVADWLSANKLTINTSKTHYIIFNRYKKFTYPLIPVKINNEILTEVTETKFLGVIVEKHLLWHKHINSIKAKVAKQCGIMYLTRDSLDRHSLLLIYNSLVYPTLIYAIGVWGGASNEALNCLVVTQKRAVRTITGLRRRDHTNNAFTNLKILKFHDLIIMFSSLFVYKSLNSLLDTENYFTTNNPNPHQTRNHPIYLPRTRSSQTQTHIKYHGAKTFNSLPPDIKSKPSLQSFKKAVKKNILATYTTIEA